MLWSQSAYYLNEVAVDSLYVKSLILISVCTLRFHF